MRLRTMEEATVADDKKKDRSGRSRWRGKGPGAGEGDGQLRDSRGPIAGIPTWKKMLVACSILLMVAGGALSAVDMMAGDSTPPAQTRSADGTGGPGGDGSTGNLVSGFAPDGSGARGDGAGGQSDDASADGGTESGGHWSPAMFKLGFSFFVGFAIAFALRTFVKISIIAIGMFLLVHFALEYYGFIQVNWDVFGDKYDSITDWLGRQTGGFKEFITGSLPSAASATTGLVLGFRKR